MSAPNAYRRDGARRLGLIMALRDEAAAILEDGRFRWARVSGYGDGAEAGSGGECRFESEAFPISFALAGVGKAFASWACARMAGDCDILLSLGTSGGLGSEKVGSLYLAREFVEYDMDATGFGYPSGVTPSSGTRDPVIRSLSPEGEALALAALAAAGLEAPWARAASGDAFIQDAKVSRELAAGTGAQLCDMECAAIAKLCALRASPERRAAGRPALDYFALRYVSDNADHNASASWDEQVLVSSKEFDAYLYALAVLL
jgi:adenosylhomocysteine nucleosidase